MKTAQWILLMRVLVLESQAGDQINQEKGSNNPKSHSDNHSIQGVVLCTLVTLN